MYGVIITEPFPSSSTTPFTLSRVSNVQGGFTNIHNSAIWQLTPDPVNVLSGTNIIMSAAQNAQDLFYMSQPFPTINWPSAHTRAAIASTIPYINGPDQTTSTPPTPLDYAAISVSGSEIDKQDTWSPTQAVSPAIGILLTGAVNATVTGTFIPNLDVGILADGQEGPSPNNLRLKANVTGFGGQISAQVMAACSTNFLVKGAGVRLSVNSARLQGGVGIKTDAGSTNPVISSNAVYYETNTGIEINSAGASGTDLKNLHCNTFAPTDPTDKTGILIGANGSLVDNQIGYPFTGSQTLKPAGNWFPAVSTRSTTCPFQPATGVWGTTCDVNDWDSPLNWTSIKNLSSNGDITYYKYFNEFVGTTSGNPSLVIVRSGKYPDDQNGTRTYLRIDNTITVPGNPPQYKDDCGNFDKAIFPINTKTIPSKKSSIISASPNPTNGKFDLQFTPALEQDDIAEVFGPLQAQSIESTLVRKGSMSVQMGNLGLTPGCYQVRMRKSRLTTRLVVQ